MSFSLVISFSLFQMIIRAHKEVEFGYDVKNLIAACSMKSLEENMTGRIDCLICWKNLCC